MGGRKKIKRLERLKRLKITIDWPLCTDITIILSVELEKNEDGFLARVPGIRGAFAEGETVEEAVFNCVDVVKMIFEYRKERNEQLGFNEFKFLLYLLVYHNYGLTNYQLINDGK